MKRTSDPTVLRPQVLKGRASNGLMEEVELLRRAVNGAIEPETRKQYAQYLTPASVAVYMASLVDLRRNEIRILDPGAGIGSLTAALVAKLLSRKVSPKKLHVTACEVDDFMCQSLSRVLNLCQNACSRANVAFSFDLRQEDLVVALCSQDRSDILADRFDEYDCVIMNPPYRKIRSGGSTRSLLRRAGIETSNLYTAFLALAARHLNLRGQLVSITPRSFCNGPYFLPFRTYFFDKMVLKRLHIFHSRSRAFRDDEVLQENLIMHAAKTTKKPGKVVVSSSEGPGDAVAARRVKYSLVLAEDDKSRVVNLFLNDEDERVAQLFSRLPAVLSDLGIEVSTGRVVDFRAREHLRQSSGRNTVPLIYPMHIAGSKINWPKEGSRKANAITRNPCTESLLVPTGNYVLVKRFSSKEERRRIVASVFEKGYAGAEVVGFENHLNYFHLSGGGLGEEVAQGLCIFLNSSFLDRYFRLFSGHTQVNASDLRSLRFPNEDQLKMIGQKRYEVESGAMSEDEILRELLSW